MENTVSTSFAASYATNHSSTDPISFYTSSSSTTTKQPPEKKSRQQPSTTTNHHYNHHHHGAPTAAPPTPPPDPRAPQELPLEEEELTGTSLYSFIRRDVEPEGHRLLLPFLTTKELLCLSECCKALSRYRTFLTRVKIVPHPVATHDMKYSTELKKGLLRLLSVDQRLGLEYLHVGHQLLLAILDELVMLGCCRGLKVLDLSRIELWDRDAARVGRVLSRGQLPNLEELNLSSSLLFDGVGHVMTPLAEGVCPGLKRLDLSGNHWLGTGTSQGIADYIGSRYSRSLQDLCLSGAGLGTSWFSSIARALQTGSCSSLLTLDRSESRPSIADGQALALALRSGACPKLKVLSLSVSYITDPSDECLVPVIEAVESSSCPDLEELDLAYAKFLTDGGRALARAVISPGGRHLRHLDLCRGFGSATCTLDFLQGILHHGAPLSLRYLNLQETLMGPQHGLVLSQALRSALLPRLEHLDLSCNSSLGDEGLIPIAEAIKAAPCPHLSHLNLMEVGMTPSSALAWAEALPSAKHIKTLDVALNRSIGDDGMKALIQALANGCPRLHCLSARHTGMGVEAGRALLEGMSGKTTWPYLQRLSLLNESLPERWVADLASVLQGGAGVALKKLELYCPLEGDYALLASAFRGGACPSLSVVFIKCPVMVCLEELKRALKGRAEVKSRCYGVEEEGEESEGGEMEEEEEEEEDDDDDDHDDSAWHSGDDESSGVDGGDSVEEVDDDFNDLGSTSSDEEEEEDEEAGG